MRDTLRKCGYPTRILTLDFETYFDSEYGLKDQSVVEYVHDPQFEIVAIGLKFDDSPAQCVCQDDRYEGYRDFLALDWDNFTVICHNSAFDLAVLNHVFDISPLYVLDTLALARHWNSRRRNDLASLCKHFRLPAKGDTKSFSGWTFRERYSTSRRSKAKQQRPIFTPVKMAEIQGYCTNDVDQTYILAEMLLPKLSNPAMELRLIRHTLDLALKPTLMLDRDKAGELLAGMEAEIAGKVAATGHTREVISANKQYEELLCRALSDAGENPDIYFKTTAKGTHKLADAKADEAGERLLGHSDSAVRALAEARRAIKSWPLHQARIERLARMAVANGGRLGVPLHYHGAHTGRWSGAGKINLQNLPKQGHPLIVAMRGLLLPPPGHKLVIVDASQIEARVLAWAAGQDDLCERFRRKADVYCEFASKVLGFTIRKPHKDKDLPAVVRRLQWARNSIGKIGVLGCIAASTPVLTDAGWKVVESVEIWDKVWDGVKFVSHEGVAYQGDKECVNVEGIWLTPDHEVLTEVGWYQGRDLCTVNPTSVPHLDRSQLRQLGVGNGAGLSPSNVFANAVEKLIRTETTLSVENLPDVMRVLKWRLLFAIPDTDLCNPRIASDFLIKFVRLLADATQNRRKDIDYAESESTALGYVIDDVFLNTWLNFRDGMTNPLKLTGSTATKDIIRETLDSLPVKKIVATYDIVRAGSNRRYQAGHLIVANCGYGMGATKTEGYAQGAINFAMAERIVQTYRSENSKIVDYWYRVEKAFASVARGLPPVDLGRGIKVHAFPDCDVCITLPSNRRLYYHRVRNQRDTGLEVYNDMTASWERTWGGALVENIVQAISRDILAEALLFEEELGYHTALHAHDELVLVVPETDAHQCLDSAIKALSIAPAWATDCPLAAEGHIGDRYGKS